MNNVHCFEAGSYLLQMFAGLDGHLKLLLERSLKISLVFVLTWVSRNPPQPRVNSKLGVPV